MVDAANRIKIANRIIREALTGMAMRKMGLTEKHYLSPLTKQHGRKK